MLLFSYRARAFARVFVRGTCVRGQGGAGDKQFLASGSQSQWHFVALTFSEANSTACAHIDGQVRWLALTTHPTGPVVGMGVTRRRFAPQGTGVVMVDEGCGGGGGGVEHSLPQIDD